MSETSNSYSLLIKLTLFPNYINYPFHAKTFPNANCTCMLDSKLKSLGLIQGAKCHSSISSESTLSTLRGGNICSNIDPDLEPYQETIGNIIT